MKVTIKVPDMTCNHCKMTIQNSVNSVNNVQNVEVNLDNKLVEITGNFEVSDVVSAIQNSGYTAEQILNIQ
jgi:copper chaperone CopZ